MPFSFSVEFVRKALVACVLLFFSTSFGYYYGITYWGNRFAGALLGFVLGMAATAIVLSFTNKTAGLFAMLGGSRKASFSLREQLESDIQQIRYHKMRKEYDIALRKVNDVLELDPDFPEALFLKAQIVWEGFGDSASAVSNLEKIKLIDGDRQSPFYRWSSSLLEEIKEKTT